jgi:hypothetical protein
MPGHRRLPERGHVAADASAGRPRGRVRLAALLDAPCVPEGSARDVKATYHLAISAAPTDRTLTDAEWAEVAELYVDRLGLARRGDDDAVRWVAVRHADNHVHVVATLVRQDGRRVFPHHDFYRARGASLEVERRYGLTPTSAVDRTGTPETTRAEQRKHQRAVRAAADAGRPAPVGPDREVLRGRVRAALAGSKDWDEFAGRLRLSGVFLRERYSTRNPGELTGYAVRVMPVGAQDPRQPAVWFGGGKLAPDLSLPQLRARWDQDAAASPGQAGAQAGAGPRGRPDRARPTGAPLREPAVELSELERRKLWTCAEHAVRRADADIRHASSRPFDAAAQDAAQAAAASAAEVLGAVSWLVERKRGGPLHAAAEDYGRAARGLHRRTVPATAHSRLTRAAAGALLAVRLTKRAETPQLLSLLAQLTALSEALARLRETQERAAQAAAARRAAEQLANEHQRRSGAASAAMSAAKSAAVASAATQAPGRPRGPAATPAAARTTVSSPPHWPMPEPSISWPGRPTGPAPAARPGRSR